MNQGSATDEPSNVEIAQADADAARARLQATLGEIGHRLRPSTIASDAAESAKDTARKAADTATTVALERPVAAGTGAAVVTSLVSWGLWRRFRRAATSSPAERSQRQTSTPVLEGRNTDGGYQHSAE